MAIEVVQTCDGCGTVRKLDIGDFETTEDIRRIGNRNSWRDVELGKKHLCPQCIKKALKN